MTPSKPTFLPTNWANITRAINGTDPESHRLLDQLYKDYWYPVYGFIRLTGRSKVDAEDLTQSFFASALGERNTFAKARKERGRFRTFIIGCVKNFLNDAHAYDTRQKRDSRNTVHFDSLNAEERYAAESKEDFTPDQYFEYSLALEVFRKIEAEFEDDLRHDGKLEIFHALRDRIYGTEDAPSYVELSARLSMPIGTLKAHVHRLGNEFRVIRSRHFERLVANPDDIEDELIQFQNFLRISRHSR